MRKRILSILAALGVLLQIVPIFPVYAETENMIWVSPVGSDSNVGTREKPVRTLEGARQRVSELLKSTDSDIEVVFRAGEYRFDSTVEFLAADSSDDINITYRAAEGEKVEFKGSKLIDTSLGTKVTDEKILSRMYSSVRNKVVCFDLKTQGFTENMVRQPAKEDGWRALVNGEVNGVYLDGNYQTVAEWPNGEATYKRWSSAVAARTIKYTDAEPNRWTAAKDFWLAGYPSYDYYYIRQSVTDINTDEKTLSIYGTGTHQFTSSQSRRWKVINLLEEIDVPGEYYIDTDDLKLYLYPSKPLKDTKMEISWLKDPMLKFENARNITFSGITFCQTRGDAVDMVNVDNIDFINCGFEDVLVHAIYAAGTVNAETDKNYWQVQDVDGSYNCDITGCKFSNIGGGAIHISGGNVDTLKKSNNVISDNMIYHANYLSKNQCAILLKGCGTTVRNNNISKCPFQAIRFYGNDHTIEYNEIYNVDQESDDCGAIYCGRNSLQRGTVISYNYIHDLFTTEELPYGFQSAIYWDDRQQGMNANHNIIKNVRMDLASNKGTDFNYSENTTVNAVYIAQNFINGGFCVNHNGGETATDFKFGSNIKYPEIYYAAYPNLKEVIYSERSDDPKLARFNIIKNNLTVNARENGIGSNTLKYGTVKGNLWLDECNDFVDPEREDFRVKSDSATAKKVSGILTDKFDIEKIGLQQNIELNEKTAPFKQLYPVNGATAVQSSEIDFEWERAFGATYYRLVIANDPELKDVVYDERVQYNLQTVKELENNHVYYWKVYAENRSRDLLSDWESSSSVYSFKTSLYDDIDTSLLNEEIEKTAANVANIDEGDNVGQYPKGTSSRIEELLLRAEILKGAKRGILKQKSVNSMVETLAGALSGIGMVNKGFLNISDYLNDSSIWHGALSYDNGTVSIESSENAMKSGGSAGLAKTTGSCIYAFDCRANTGDYAMIAFAKYIDMAPYSSANTGYSICVKPDVTELQLSTGTAHSVVETVNKTFANDGKYHRVEFGFINIGIGNLVVLYVDGESWIEYLDIFNTAVNNNCELSLFTRKAAGDSISVKVCESVSSEQEYNDLLKRNIYKAVELVLDKFETTDKITLFTDKASKIFSENGVFDVSFAPNEIVNGQMMIAFEKVDKIFGVSTYEQNGECYIDGKGKLNTTADKNGHKMVSAEEVLTLINRSGIWSESHATFVAGDIIFMNNVEYLNKSLELLKLFDGYDGDVLFDNN